MSTSEKSLTITDAAVLLGMSYNQVWRLLLRGDLAGGRTAAGGWQLTAASVKAFKKTHPQPKKV